MLVIVDGQEFRVNVTRCVDSYGIGDSPTTYEVEMLDDVPVPDHLEEKVIQAAIEAYHTQ